MAFKLLILVACLALVGQLTHVQACRCVPSHDTICKTDFLALVKITRTQVESPNTKQHYIIDLIEDVAIGTHKRRSLKGLVSIEDTMDSCGFFLQPNQTYLIGGWFDGDNHTPRVGACNSIVENWQQYLVSNEKSNARLAELKATCAPVIPTE